MRKTRSRRSQNTTQDVSINEETKASLVADDVDHADHADVTTRDDLNKKMNGLRCANDELVKDNANKKLQIATLHSDRLKLMNEVNQLSTELGAFKTQQQDVNAMVKDILRKFGQLSDDLLRLLERTHVINYSPTIEMNTKRKTNAINITNAQQTHAVKPMISGHTIQNPVINLPRVSPEQLERMIGRVANDSNVNNINEEADMAEASIDDVTLVATLQEDNNEINGEQVMETIESENHANSHDLPTIMEEPEFIISPSVNVNTRRRHLQAFHAHSEADLTISNNSLQVPEETANEPEATISNVLRTSQRVTMRRRQNIPPMPVETATSLISSPTASASLLQESVMSNTHFIDGLGAADMASTPLAVVNNNERRRIQLDNDRIEASASNVSVRRGKMPQCSVIITRLSTTVKRKSISPRPSRSSEISSNRTDLTDPSTISASSPKRRPTRAAKPKNLKESTLKGKLRRRN